MNKQIISVALILFSFGCTDNELHQCKSDSIEDIGWLKTEIETNYSGSSDFYDVIVYKANYQLGPVFIILICCPSCGTTPPVVKNCSGKTIGQLGVDVDDSILDNAKVMWRTNNGVCPG